jgi:hypothetical protein
MKERRRRQEGRTDSTEQLNTPPNEPDNLEEAMARDQAILDEEELPKPAKPVHGGDSEARDRIISVYEIIRRKPGLL